MLYDSDSKSVESLEFPKTPEIPVEFLPKTPKESTVIVPKTPEMPPILFCETEIWTRAKRPEVEARKVERSKSEGVGLIRRFGRSYQLTVDNRLRMKQPFKTLVDIWDVLVPRSFHETLDKYVEEQLPVYLQANLESVLCQKVLQEFIDQADKMPQLPAPDRTGSREEQIQAMLKNILYRQKNRPQAETLFQDILDDIWQEGYRSKRLRPPLFEEVLPVLKQWNSDPLFIKVYTLATGTMEHQKQFLQATEFGKPENTYLIKDHFNSQGSYRQLLFGRICSTMNEWRPQNLFYITSSITRAKEARKAKLTPIVILREGLAKYPKERLDDENIIAITKLKDLEFYEFASNRRECC